MKIRLINIIEILVIESLVLLSLSPAAIGEKYYVSPTGSDKNSGSKASPWRNIQKAADNVRPGDTVIVKDGIYTDANRDGYVVLLRRSGTSSNWITFKAESKWGAVLDGQGRFGSDNVLAGFRTSNGVAYIRIEDFELIRSRVGINYAGAHDIYIKGCRIHNIGRYWTIPGPCDYDRRGDRYFSGVTGNALASNITIDGCFVHDIGRAHLDPCCRYDYSYDHGLYLAGWNIVAQNNVIYNIHSGWTIKIDGNKGSGDPPYRRSTHIISNNTMGHQLKGYSPCLPSGSQGHILIIRSHGEYRPHDIIIQNNLIYNPPGNRAIQVRYYVDLAGSVFRNNVTSSTNLWGRYGGVEHLSIPLESDNLTAIPFATFELDDPDKGRFAPISYSSPLVNSGFSDFAPRVDYRGVARPQDGTVDIGAYEYTPQGNLAEDNLSRPGNLRVIRLQ